MEKSQTVRQHSKQKSNSTWQVIWEEHQLTEVYISELSVQEINMVEVELMVVQNIEVEGVDYNESGHLWLEMVAESFFSYLAMPSIGMTDEHRKKKNLAH